MNNITIPLGSVFQLHIFIVNPFHENTYVLVNSETGRAIIIDPGIYSKEEENGFDRFVQERKIKLDYLLITHGHLDHILGCGYIQSAFSPQCIAPKEDRYLFETMAIQSAAFGIEERALPRPGSFFEDIAKLQWENLELQFIHSPGHTKGEHSIYCPELAILFAGDVLFKESIGRTDLPGGDTNVLLSSIADKIFTLPAKTIVFPGHGEATTIEYEINHNPFFF